MSYAKRRIALRYWLQGKGYYQALRAMNYVEEMYEGNFRKDGVTPEFDHVVTIACHIRTLPDLIYPEATIIAGLGHDVSEPPYDRARAEYEPIFGELAAAAVEKMTKKHRGKVKDEGALDEAMILDPIASLVKPIDRNHNLSTMGGVFELPKQANYVEEAERRFLHMLKRGRRNFPQQEAAYENVRVVMDAQTRLIRSMLAAHKAA